MEIKVIKRNVVPDRITLYENDIGSKRLIFSTPKISDGISLVDLNGFLEIERDTGLTDRFFLDKTISNDTVYFSIEVGLPLTEIASTLTAQISFESKANTLVYKTAVFFIEVKSSVDGTDSYEQLEPSVIKQLEDKMLENINTASQLVETFEKTKNDISQQFNQDIINAVEGLRQELSPGLYGVEEETLICNETYVGIKEEILLL